MVVIGNVKVLSATKNPLEFMGMVAGICWGADVSNAEANVRRALDCIKSGHGRVTEYADVTVSIKGYSAKVIREWYTHIGGSPSRLQESTRYIDFTKTGVDCVVPPSIERNQDAKEIYNKTVGVIADSLGKLKKLGIPNEDRTMILPLAMKTGIVDKRNLRNIGSMVEQRLCSRAYWEYRNELMKDYLQALSEIDGQWKWLVDNYLKVKCDKLGYCPEARGCGKFPHKS